MSNVKIYSSNMQFGLPASAQRYLKHFQPLKIIALLELFKYYTQVSSVVLKLTRCYF